MSEPTSHANTLPPVDVVIATHHRPELVREAIAAVRAQTYAGRIRCYVVHDGTTPDSSLARNDKQREVVVLYNSATPGLAGSRNSGVRAGTAPYIAFCDDDDLWHPTKIERQVDLINRTGVSTVVTGVTVHYAGKQMERLPRAEDLTLGTLARRRVMAAHPSTVLVRRTALLADIGLFDERIPGGYGEDYDWILRAVAADEVGVLESALVDVRWGGSQFSRQWQTIVDALGYLLAKHDVFATDPRALGRVEGQRAFALAAQHRGGAFGAIARTFHLAPAEPRAYLAAAVALHLVSADRVLDAVNRRGRGI